MTDAPELKPCPFCGGPAELWRANEDQSRTAFIGCMGGCATLVSRAEKTDAECIRAWNTRTADRERDAAVAAALERAAEAAYQWWDDDDAQDLREHIRAMIPDEGRAALDAMLAAVYEQAKDDKDAEYAWRQEGLEAEIERLREARDLAYGLLWSITLDTRSGVGRAWSKARAALLATMTKQDRARGITLARAALEGESDD